MVFLSIILCVLNIQAQSHFKLYKSEGHFYWVSYSVTHGYNAPRKSVRRGREFQPPDAR